MERLRKELKGIQKQAERFQPQQGPAPVQQASVEPEPVALAAVPDIEPAPEEGQANE